MLDLYPELMLAMLIVFFVMLYYLSFKLYTPLLKFINDRDIAIKKDIEAIECMIKNTDELQAQIKSILDEARATATKIRQDAVEEAKIKGAESIAKKQAELDRAQEKIIVELEKEKVALKNSLISQMPLVKESIKAKFSRYTGD